MNMQGIGNRLQGIVHATRRCFRAYYNLEPNPSNLPAKRGFTLIETLAAVVLLTISITAPMLLTVRSLSSAYYARDQFTAFYLAQEAIEAVHQVRDNQILTIAKTSAGGIDLFPCAIDGTGGTAPKSFTVDGRPPAPADVIRTTGSVGACINSSDPNSCPPLESDGQLYGYEMGWSNTNFTRYVNACYVGGDTNEVQISVTVKWQTAAQNERTFTISENMYRWIQDASGT